MIVPLLGAVAQNTLLSGTVCEEKLSLAYELNRDSRYDEAYGAISEARKLLIGRMREESVTAVDLGHEDFHSVFFNVYVSYAEIAYKLGLFSEMQEISEVLADIVDRRKDSDSDKLYCRARIAKINGGAFYLTGLYDKAEREYQKFLDYWPHDVNLTYAIRLELAQLHYARKGYSEALEQLLAAETLLGNLRRGMAAAYDVTSRLKELNAHKALCLARLGRFAEAHSLLDYVSGNGNAEWLRRKAKVMMLEYDASGSYNPQAGRYYQEYLEFARRHVNDRFLSMTSSQREQWWQNEKSFVTDCYRLEDKAPELLYDVALFSKAVLLQMGRLFKPGMSQEEKEEALSASMVTWRDVRRNMPKHSSAVEFVVYEKKDTSRIGALVLNKAAESPAFVEIAPVSALASLYYREGVCDEKLPSMLWNEQILDLVHGCDRIYFSADGILHQIPVEYMLPESLESVGMYRLTSTRMLAESRKPLQMDSLLVCGGVNYYSVVAGNYASGNDALSFESLSSRGLALRYLDGSKEEAEYIMALRNNEADSLLTDSDVSEATVRSLMNGYDAVHFSTHGYFADQPGRNGEIVPMSSDEQLSRNCLFLSGAQRNLDNASFDSAVMDGILSAREIAGLDLDGVDLVVMSACQSGLGYVTTDGVFGLQRGMKAAGAGAIIASLWNVDDMASSIFFKRLYSNLNKGVALHQAFSEAREYLMKKSMTVTVERTARHDIRRTLNFDKEKYYNAFILIDGIE